MEILTTTVNYLPATTEEYYEEYGYIDYDYDISDGYYIGNPVLKIVSLVIYSLVFMLGVLGNGVVIWVTGFKMKKTVNTIWYLNLAVADFLFTALLPLRITEIALDRYWPFGRFMCKLNSAVLFLNMYASIYVLMVISVDRCVCVVWPVWAKNHRSVRKASCVSLSVWVLALALSLPYFVFMDSRPYSRTDDTIMCRNNFALTNYGLFTEREKLPLVSFRHGSMIITRFLMGFVVPVTIIVFCYSVIVHKIRRNRSLASQSGRPFRIIAVVITTFFLCWAPYHILQIMSMNLAEELGDSETLEHVIIIAFSLAYINSCLNPLLYVFMGHYKNTVSRSVLKKLQKAFTEDQPSTNPGITSQETSLSETQV